MFRREEKKFAVAQLTLEFDGVCMTTWIVFFLVYVDFMLRVFVEKL